MSWFKKKEKKPFEIPPITFRWYVPTTGQDLWKCNRCGALCVDGEQELHSQFHSTQDRLLEKLMMILEKFE